MKYLTILFCLISVKSKAQLLIKADTLLKPVIIYVSTDSTKEKINDKECKHLIQTSTSLYCPEMNCNTIRCFTCGKKLN